MCSLHSLSSVSFAFPCTCNTPPSFLNALTAVTQQPSLVGRRPRQTRLATPYSKAIKHNHCSPHHCEIHCQQSSMTESTPIYWKFAPNYNTEIVRTSSHQRNRPGKLKAATLFKRHNCLYPLPL
uniref:Uncharacterized protein MANES_16G007200 n=1 Tax=Rhizophora mucronata TaxID=61149 RepID=A0A2P2KSK8_RHIMU